MDDERQTELDCLEAIYPEIILDPKFPFSASLELPVAPTNTVNVIFPIASDSIAPAREGPNNLQPYYLSYLPPIQIQVSLPDGYPENNAPEFKLSMSTPWLSQVILHDLEHRGKHMWEEAGRSSIVYGYFDMLQQAAEDAFGLAVAGKVLEVSPDHRIAMLDYDIKAKQAAFEMETFECGICLDPKKGSACYRLTDCGHVFCVNCLQNFYNNAIQEGDITSVKCLTPECAKKRRDAEAERSKKPRVQISPSELLQIPLEPEMVTRYVKLWHKAELESDRNTIYCPRSWCQGAARSRKHPKPKGLEIVDVSDAEEEDSLDKNEKFISSRADLLSICEDCSYAFCSRCYKGWHGERFLCHSKAETKKLSAEEEASQSYIKRYTTPCPTCAAPSQKQHGCNHMICYRCQSHYCYLCSAWLDASNPYKHYNSKGTECYQRLWVLETGDGEDVEVEHEEGVLALIRAEAMEAEGQFHVEVDPPINQQNPLAEVPENGREAAGNNLEDDPTRPVRAPVEREGPLVFRINQVPQAAAAVHAVPAAPAAGLPEFQARALNQNRRARPAQGVRAAPGQARAHNGMPLAANRGPDADAANQEWVRMFVEMALQDEEDQLGWDSGDELDPGAWVIPFAN